MGRSNHFADMYRCTHTQRQHVRSNRQFVCGTWVVGQTIVVANQGCNSRWQKGKSKAKTRQYKEDQFRALEDRCEASPTQISNLYRHNGNESKHPSAERRTHGLQHHAQAHATWWVDGFKLNIPEFQWDLQPKEFMDLVVAVEEVLDFKEVPEDRRVSLVTTKLIDEYL
jgi:hypothetical protein